MMDSTKYEPSTLRDEVNPESAAAALQGANVPESVRQGWRQLHGRYYELGVSMEGHDFEVSQPFEWSRCFQPGSLKLCLNLSGKGTIHYLDCRAEVMPLSATFCISQADDGLQAWREVNQRHQFVTVDFSARFLRAQLASCDGALHPLIESFIRGGALTGLATSEVERLTSTQEQLVSALLNPPVPQRARSLWYQGKVQEVMAEFFFERQGEDELFCDRQKRLARERVTRVMNLLALNLAAPLSLEQLSRKVGCSSFHLSRTFSAETGTTIQQYLRRLRMERAAQLLRSGKYNVTEAAFEVGYSSLSHFSQAFCQIMGCCPGLYPLKRHY